MRDAVRRAETLRRQDRLAEAAAVLEQAEGQIDALPDPAARPKALLVVRALRCALLANLGSGRREAAGRLCVQARQEARAAQVWALPEVLRFRVMLLLALWETAPADATDAALREEASELLDRGDAGAAVRRRVEPGAGPAVPDPARTLVDLGLP